MDQHLFGSNLVKKLLLLQKLKEKVMFKDGQITTNCVTHPL